jgi:pimeloyl-ACP methyl ester carboxylesterase
MNLCKHPRIAFCAIVIAIVSAVSGNQPARAAEAAQAASASRYAATIVPDERFEIRGVLVERHGSAGGRPLVLILGLASGSWAWQDTIRAFAGEHPIYVLTLPGFDGRPAAGPAPLANARAAVEALIASRHLDKPVLIGHSLGGTLGLAVAEDQPATVGGVIGIDGLPVMPGTEQMPAAARTQAAQRMQGAMAHQTPTVFASQQQTYMRTIGVLDMTMADELAKLSARSDPASAGQYAADDVALDLRPGLQSITAPVLMLVPFYDQDSVGITENDKVAYYRDLMQGTPKLQVTAIAPARHFAMFDQPGMVNDAIRAFLKSL